MEQNIKQPGSICTLTWLDVRDSACPGLALELDQSGSIIAVTLSKTKAAWFHHAITWSESRVAWCHGALKLA